MPRQTTAPRFLRISEVLQMTGMGKTFIYVRMKHVTFPNQIQLAFLSVDWINQASSSGMITACDLDAHDRCGTFC